MMNDDVCAEAMQAIVRYNTEQNAASSNRT